MTSPTEPTPNAELTEISKAVRSLCNGHPHARIAWPHRELHEIADRLDGLATPSPAAWTCPFCGMTGDHTAKCADALERSTGVRPAAQADPAKGLEVVGWTSLATVARCLARSMGGYTMWANPTDKDSIALTDHATATLQLAERDARIASQGEYIADYQVDLAEANKLIRSLGALHREACGVAADDHIARLAAEADAARVREEADALLADIQRQTQGPTMDARIEAFRSAQTQRGA